MRATTTRHANENVSRKPVYQRMRIAAAAGWIICCAIGTALAVVEERVDVTVRDAISGAVLTDLRVDARRRVGDDLQWAARAYTDDNGQASFSLEGIGEGVPYVFSAAPYNGGTVYSTDVTQPGPFEFRVGKLAVRVVAGGSGDVLSDLRVDLREVRDDGSLQWRGRGTTDDNGIVRLDPPGIGKGQTYLLEARSPWDGSRKRSHHIRSGGEITFVVGNAPLHVHLHDGINGAPIGETRVTAYERFADGGSRGITSRTTDDEGNAVFDLDGLGDGRVYYLRASVFNGGPSYTPDLESPGDLDFPVGTLAVSVVDGGSGEALPETKIWAYELGSDGAKKYRRGGYTDGDGIIRFDLPGLGDGAAYVLRAKSPVDGSTKYSNQLTHTGAIEFPVGNAPLVVKLANYFTKQGLPGIRIWAREQLADGSTRGVFAVTTDQAGIARFDLDGLGDGRTYELAATPYNGGRITTGAIDSAGELLWPVGKLEVTVVDGVEQNPLANVRIYARERLDDGRLRYRASGYTNEFGMIRFDPPGLGEGATYVLQANSPFDGSRKLSDDIKEPARKKFVVGNRPLDVSLVNGITGDPVPGKRVYAYRVTEEKLVYTASRITDAEGFARFDLDGLGDGVYYVLKTTPYNGGRVQSSKIREGGHFEFRVGTFEVKVVAGSDGSVLADAKVWAYRLGEEGKLDYAKSGKTDAEGVVRFDLPGLDEGVPHVLRAISPVDGTYKYSDPYDSTGTAIFRVGNAPLEVHVANGVDGTPVGETRIDAYERVPGEERLKWRGRSYTDEGGVAIFDLDGLGTGRVYVLRINPYNGGTVYSEEIDSPGKFEFPVGTLRVLVTSGATGEALVDYRVDAREVTDDGLKWRARGTTDADGIIHFDLPGLGSGRNYVLEATSPIDGTKKRSAEISALGIFEFEVGAKPVDLTVVNAISNQPIANLRVTVRELLAEKESRWVSSLYTGESGRVSFDIDGIDDAGRHFLLETKPYNGGTVRTEMIPGPGDYRLRLGTIPVTLIDADNDVAIPGASLTAYEKLADGKLRWTTSGTTDDSGIVHFDLAGVSDNLTPGTSEGGAIYVFKAYKPFGEGRKYYSQLITEEGPVEFRVSREGEAPLDLTPPEIEITAPTDGANVNSAGFAVDGIAADNATLTQVEVEIVDPVVGATVIAATYDPATLRWSAAVPAAAVTAGQVATIVATASDQALNQASAAVTVNPIADSLPPQVTIGSHSDGDDVGSSGFLLSGTATDDIGVTSIEATIADPTIGLSTVTIGVANDGRWTLAVSSSQITEGNSIDVTVTAFDAAGRSATAAVRLDVIAVDFATRHLIDRITFGATPDLLIRAEAMGASAFLAEQLDPAAIDDSALAGRLPAQIADDDDLQAATLLRAIYSERQLLEVLTQFWDNHFNTNLGTHDDVGYEASENAAFRANALGRFRDLLDASAKSPAMLIYLDQANSVAANPNENYPREVMELHTLKVNGPYTQDDVEALARILTGWTLNGGSFAFDPNMHDFGAKVFLGLDFPAGQGQAEGERALDILASHPSTANFVCEKLAVLFISDTPPATAIARCAATFLQEEDNPGQLREVVRSLLTSPEFADASNFRNKVRTPLEQVTSLIRTMGIDTNGYGLLGAMSDMNMRLFYNPVPTGYSETGDDWTSSDQSLQRTKHANRIARGFTNGTTVSMRDFFLARGQVTADGIVPFAMRLFFHDDYTALEEQAARDVLTDTGSVVFDIDAGDAESRLRRMMATIASFPGVQFQ